MSGDYSLAAAAAAAEAARPILDGRNRTRRREVPLFQQSKELLLHHRHHTSASVDELTAESCSELLSWIFRRILGRLLTVSESVLQLR